MPVKKHSQSLNSQKIDTDSADQITSRRNKSPSLTKTLRKKPQNKCLQNNLLYANNLPLWFQDEKAIKDNKYFGKYGTITSIIATTKKATEIADEAPQYVQAYITYSNQKDVAMVIAAVNDISCHSMALKTTYGTSRLCNNYINGKRCTIKGCFWLHDQKNIIKIQGPFKADFQKQRLIAYEVIKNNLSYFINKIELAKLDQQKTNKKDDSLVKFPSIEETINKLVDKKIISKFLYQKAYEEYLSTKKKMSQTVKKIIYIRKRTQSNTNPSTDNQIQNKVLVQKQQIPEKIEKVEKKQNLISEYFKTKKKERNQFLMNLIMQSLEESEQAEPKKKQTQVVDFKKTWSQPEPIFTEFYTNKLFEQQDLLQTQASQSGEKENKEIKTLKTSNKNSKKIIYAQKKPALKSSINTVEQNTLIDKVKQQIMKNQLVKVSKLQFTQSIPFNYSIAQYEKVTMLLKNKLIE